MARSTTAAPRSHWPEYLIEAWALGTFMIAAGVCATLLEYPGSPLHRVLADPGVRRGLAGLTMGLTAIAIIYSPWGKRSGAHMNPAVTLAFLSLGRVRRADAVFFVLAQFVGGVAGVLVVLALFGAAFSAPPVSYAATVPGEGGAAIAFAAEFLISAALIFVILRMQASSRAAPFTGVVAGCLVASYISLEAPLSGMSMNPARTFASAAPGLMWQHLWIYFTAPVAGMLAAAQLYRLLFHSVGCAKLVHPDDIRCIHCGYEPPPGRPVTAEFKRSTACSHNAPTRSS
jgi:aquaporin Z